MAYDFETEEAREQVRAAAEAIDIADRCQADAAILEQLGEVIGVDTLRAAGIEITRLRREMKIRAALCAEQCNIGN